jgi:hypothetical protein
VEQGATGGSATNQHFITCDAVWRRIELRVFGDGGPFSLGPATIRAFFTVQDPNAFDPVHQSQDIETVTVVAAPGSPVLYDQTTSQAGAIISSDLVVDSNDSQGADDFIVPSGETWAIDSVNAPGAFGGPDVVLPRVNVFVYQDGGTEPGTLVASFLGVQSTTGPDNLTIPISPALSLAAGTYWISIQADLSDLPDGNSWLWGFRSVDMNDVGVWRQPTNTAFAPFNDFRFTLRGTIS